MAATAANKFHALVVVVRNTEHGCRNRMGTRALTILNHITVKNGDSPGTRFELRCYLPGDAEGTVVATEFGQYLLIPSWQAEGVAELLKL